VRIPKKYGESRSDVCPFCGKAAFLKNKVGLFVCKEHKNTDYPAIKCMCGEWLDVTVGKYGNYCTCLRCGPINLKKALVRNGVLE
jgi:hypothetical protein